MVQEYNTVSLPAQPLQRVNTEVDSAVTRGNRETHSFW